MHEVLLGFIVIQMNAMVTSFFYKAFKVICSKKLKKTGFLDCIAWTKIIAAKYPYIEIEHIGILSASALDQKLWKSYYFIPNIKELPILRAEAMTIGWIRCGGTNNR
jgi:hypothetical protein